MIGVYVPPYCSLVMEIAVHELALADALIKTAVKELQSMKESRIISITVEVGKLSGVNIDSLSFCIPIVARGTPAEGCEIKFEEIEARVLCEDCKEEYHLEEYFLPCPKCGSFNRKFLSGKEFTLKNMEVA